MDVLTCPRRLFQAVLESLASGQRAVSLKLGRRLGTHRVEWLVREFVGNTSGPDVVPGCILTVHSNPVDGRRALASLGGREAGTLVVSRPESPLVSGAVWIFGGLRPIGRLSLVGSGMHRLVAAPLSNWASGQASRAGDHGPKESAQDDARATRSQARWSRTIGALGGYDAWHRLSRLHIGVVGCGRTGSLVAGMLVRLGLRRITLVDEDRVEFHNLGEMEHITERDLGLPKVPRRVAAVAATTSD